MSKQREAMEIALKVIDHINTQYALPSDLIAIGKAKQAIREALAEPEQEPVAWMYHGILHTGTPHDRPSLIWRPEYMDAMSAVKGAKATPLYTAPPQRKPLTDAEIDAEFTRECYVSVTFADGTQGIALDKVTARDFARAIERAHGIGGEA